MFVISFLGILYAMSIGALSDSILIIFILCVMCLVSMVGLIIFSKTGWSVRGSEGEWDAAIIMNPSTLMFWNRNYKEQIRNEDGMDQKNDQEHYKGD